MSRSLEDRVSDLRVDIAKLQTGHCHVRTQLNAHDARLTELGSRMTGADHAIRGVLHSLHEKTASPASAPSPEKKQTPWAEITKIGTGLLIVLAVILSKVFPEHAGLFECVLR